MPNWCANRIEITAPSDVLAKIELWAKGREFPSHQKAIQQSIRLFLAGVAGRLKPLQPEYYAPYPALTAHGCAERCVQSEAFSEWLALLQENVWLDAEHCTRIDRCYQACGLNGMCWADLSEEEQACIAPLLRSQHHDWYAYTDNLSVNISLFDTLDLPPDAQAMDLRFLCPTQLACEVNGFNGRLLTGVSSTYDLYTHYYGTKWPVNCEPKMYYSGNTLILDFDTAWAPPSEAVLSMLSERYSCRLMHYFSEAGCDFCGYAQYQQGEQTESEDSCLEREEDDDEWYEIVGPSWIIDNVTHYGG